MGRVALLSCLFVLLCGIAGAEGPAPKVALAESEAVRKNGVDFQVVVTPKWATPTDQNGTPVSLSLKVTNHSTGDLQLNIFDTINIQMKDAAGTPLTYRYARDGTRNPTPVLVRKDASALIDYSAKLLPVAAKDGPFRLIGYDKSGGEWCFDHLKSGKYTINMNYDDARFGDSHAVVPTPAPDAKDVPFWHGQCATKEVAIEIADEHAAP